MLSFFEMYHLLEADWRDQFGLPKGKPPIDARYDDDDEGGYEDPNTGIGQGIGKLGKRAISKRISNNWKGPQAMGLPVNQNDARLNAARRTGKNRDVSFFDPAKMLDQQDPDAAKIFHQMRLNSGVNKGGTFTLRELATMLGIKQPGVLKKTLMLLSMLPKQAPVHISRRPGIGGASEDVYKIDPLIGHIEDPDDDQRVLGPRQVNPAMRGGHATQVGRPAPQQAKPADQIDRTPGLLRQLLKMSDALDDMLSGQSANMNVTQALGMKRKMEELLPDARREVEMAASRRPEEAKEWRYLLGEIENLLKSLPADFGVVHGESRTWRYYSA